MPSLTSSISSVNKRGGGKVPKFLKGSFGSSRTSPPEHSRGFLSQRRFKDDSSSDKKDSPEMNNEQIITSVDDVPPTLSCTSSPQTNGSPPAPPNTPAIYSTSAATTGQNVDPNAVPILDVSQKQKSFVLLSTILEPTIQEKMVDADQQKQAKYDSSVADCEKDTYASALSSDRSEIVVVLPTVNVIATSSLNSEATSNIIVAAEKSIPIELSHSPPNISDSQITEEHVSKEPDVGNLEKLDQQQDTIDEKIDEQFQKDVQQRPVSAPLAEYENAERAWKNSAFASDRNESNHRVSLNFWGYRAPQQFNSQTERIKAYLESVNKPKQRYYRQWERRPSTGRYYDHSTATTNSDRYGRVDNSTRNHNRFSESGPSGSFGSSRNRFPTMFNGFGSQHRFKANSSSDKKDCYPENSHQNNSSQQAADKNNNTEVSYAKKPTSSSSFASSPQTKVSPAEPPNTPAILSTSAATTGQNVDGNAVPILDVSQKQKLSVLLSPILEPTIQEKMVDANQQKQSEQQPCNADNNGSSGISVGPVCADGLEPTVITPFLISAAKPKPMGPPHPLLQSNDGVNVNNFEDKKSKAGSSSLVTAIHDPNAMFYSAPFQADHKQKLKKLGIGIVVGKETHPGALDPTLYVYSKEFTPFQFALQKLPKLKPATGTSSKTVTFGDWIKFTAEEIEPDSGWNIINYKWQTGQFHSIPMHSTVVVGKCPIHVPEMLITKEIPVPSDISPLVFDENSLILPNHIGRTVLGNLSYKNDKKDTHPSGYWVIEFIYGEE